MTSGHKSVRVFSLTVGLLSFLVGLLMLLSSCFGGTVYVSPDFDGTPQSGVAPLTVQFTSYLGSHTSGCSWSFGDGGTSTEESPGHTYTSPGTYTVTLETTPTYTAKLGTTPRRDVYGSATCTKKDYIIVQSAPLPDLVVDSVTHSPTSPSVGDSVTFSVTVKNQGPVGASTFHVLLAGAAASTGGTVSSLAAGASTSLTLYLNLTTNPETFTATADSLNEVPESNETNNTAERTVNAGALPTPPDLIVTGLTQSPISPSRYDAVEFAVTVRNQGTSAAGAFNVSLRGEGTYANSTVSALAAGTSITISMSLLLSLSVETFTATADSASQVPESNETNNTAQIPVVAGTDSDSPAASILYCVEQGSFDYCGHLSWGYSQQWLQNGATSEIHLDDARKAGSLAKVGAVEFNRIEIRLRAYGCYSDSWASLTVDNIEVQVESTGQVIVLDDMEGNVQQRWTIWERNGGGELLPVASPDDASQALKAYCPSGVSVYCSGLWAVRSFDLPLTANTSDAILRLFVLGDGWAEYHEGFLEIRLYKGP